MIDAPVNRKEEAFHGVKLSIEKHGKQ